MRPKSAIYTPKRDDEHPRHLDMYVSLSPRELDREFGGFSGVIGVLTMPSWARVFVMCHDVV